MTNNKPVLGEPHHLFLVTLTVTIITQIKSN